MDSNVVFCKRVFVANGDAIEYVDIYPSYVMVRLMDWTKPRRFDTKLKDLYQRLHNSCGVCYLDNKEEVVIDLDPLYEDFGDHRERMIILEFEKIDDDDCLAKVSFRELVEAVYFWIR